METRLLFHLNQRADGSPRGVACRYHSVIGQEVRINAREMGFAHRGDRLRMGYAHLVLARVIKVHHQIREAHKATRSVTVL